MSQRISKLVFPVMLVASVVLMAVFVRLYGAAFLQRPVVQTSADFAGTTVSSSSVLFELPAGAIISETPSVSADAKRALLAIKMPGSQSSAWIWEEGLGLRPLGKKDEPIAFAPALSPEGLRSAYFAPRPEQLGTYELRIAEDGIKSQTVVEGIFYGHWRLSFSLDGNRLLAIPANSESKFEGALQASSGTPTPDSRGIVVLEFLPRAETGRSREDSALIGQPSYRIFSAATAAGHVLETTASGAVVQVLAQEDKTSNQVVRTSIVSPRRPMFQDIDRDGGADLLLFKQGAELPVWRAYSLGGSDGPMSKPSSREGTLATWRVGDGHGLPVPADYNGDGILDLATFATGMKHDQTRTYGNWQIIFSSPPNTIRGVPSFGEAPRLEILWGAEGDPVPVPGDYDGDGAADIAVFDRSSARWQLLFSSGGFRAANAALNMNEFGRLVQFGEPGDRPVVADYDGNGKSDLALFSEQNIPGAACRWKVRFRGKVRGKLRRTEVFEFGQTGDIPVPADFDGDGAADIAVFRPEDGSWHIRQPDGTAKVILFSLADVEPNPIYPIAEDFDGDNKADLAFYVPNGYFKWRILPSSFREDARFRMPNSLRVITTMNLGGPGFLPPNIWLREHYKNSAKLSQAN